MLAYLFFLAVSTAAHSILTFPKSRVTGTQMSYIGMGVKVANFPPTAEQLASCLDSTPEAPSMTLAPGADLQVKWNVTLDHPSDPGVRIAIQYPGEPMAVLQDKIDVHLNQTMVKLPADKTGNAVLQYIWASQVDGG